MTRFGAIAGYTHLASGLADSFIGEPFLYVGAIKLRTGIGTVDAGYTCAAFFPCIWCLIFIGNSGIMIKIKENETI